MGKRCYRDLRFACYGVIVRAIDLELITLEPASRNDDNSPTTAQGPGRTFRWLGWVDGGSGGAVRRRRLLRLVLGLGLAHRLPLLDVSL
jgi:hypothetical protein